MIKPFKQLQDDEREMSKEEIASLLNLYTFFVTENIKRPNKSFFENFISVKDLGIKHSGDSEAIDYIRRTSFFVEYDIMIQVAKLYTLNKFFSYYIDSNLYMIGEEGKKEVKEDFFIEGSNKYNVRDTINYIRNALNHNDKDDFQLFRLIQKENDPQIYVEVYLRKPNFHIMVTIEEMMDLLRPVLFSTSLYDFICYSENGEVFDFEKYLDGEEPHSYEISQLHSFEFTEEELKEHIVRREDGEIFSKRIEFTSEQKESMRNLFNSLKGKNIYFNQAYANRVFRNMIPFGMGKIDGLGWDLNNFLNYIYDYNKSYNDFRRDLLGNVSFDTDLEFIRNMDNSFYDSDSLGRFNRAFVMYASYILDTIIPDGAPIIINGISYDKEHIRNSLVHGTFFNYIPSNSKDDSTFILYDYPHKSRGKTDNSLIMDNPVVNKFKTFELYDSLINYSGCDCYSTPIDFVGSLYGFDGLKVTYKDGDIRYLVNASLGNETPIFLGLIDINGQLLFMNDEDFDNLSEKINRVDFKARGIDDSEMISYIKRIPSICRKATSDYLRLYNEGNLTSESYGDAIRDEVNKLSELCVSHPYGFQRIFNKEGTTDVYYL